MFVSIERRTFELSTFAQFFAVGTNQVDLAACASAEPGVPLTRLSSEVVFGRLPAFTIPACEAFEVKSAIQASASDWFWLAAGMARSEPPMKAGITRPATWLGIGKAPMTGFSFGLPAFGSSA